MKANRKRLKADLALGVKKLGPLTLALKLDKFPLFNGFLDLANFRDLDIFWPFDFLDFLAISTLPTPSPPSLSPTSSEVNLSDSLAVFSIKVKRVAILLKP